MKKHFFAMMPLVLSSAAGMAQSFGAGPAAQPDTAAATSSGASGGVANGTAAGNPAAPGPPTHTLPSAPAPVPAYGSTPTAPGGIAPATGNVLGGAAHPPSGAGMAAGATTGQSGNAAAVTPGSATRFDPTSVPGWSMMTPQEQQAYSDRMNSVTTLGQCRALNAAIVAQMQNRAHAMGQTLDARQSADPCAAMQRQGTQQR